MLRAAARSRGASVDVMWKVRLDADPAVRPWDMRVGPPPVRSMRPVRRPLSGDMSRHIPVHTVSMRTGAWLHLESGLEHDLVRTLDRDPLLVWLVPQPCTLTVGGVPHTPDLLSVTADDVVTVWDVRAVEKQDEVFERARATSLEACESVGWRYEVFEGLAATYRLNLLWLHSFRRPPAWLDGATPAVMAAAEGGTTLGSLLALDAGDGLNKAAVWHLVWTGDLALDLAEVITEATPVASGVRSDA